MFGGLEEVAFVELGEVEGSGRFRGPQAQGIDVFGLPAGDRRVVADGDDLLGRLESARPLDRLRAELLDDLWKVLEGVSHFNCVAWKAAQDRTVTLLELELQGEIDKFVGTVLLALGQDDAELSRRVHGWLFDDVRYHDELNGEQLDRYRSANDYAARYCHRLRRQLLRNPERTLEELRQFYRLQLSDKISHIHSRAWAQA